MRHLVLASVVFCLVALSVTAVADIPKVINYQGKVTDTGGTPVADGDYSMTFTIYDAETSGTSLWSSGADPVTISGGIFSVLLGGSPQPTLDLDFDSDCWLEINIAGDIQSPRSRLGSIGYAYMASGLVPGTVVIGSVTDDPYAAMKGVNTATGDYITYGGYFESASTHGRGMGGYASSTSGVTYGGRFVSDSSSGRGVYGWATATSGATYGVWGRNESPEGRGVYGWASVTDGNAFGVMGRSDSSTGRGVYGWASATSGFACGVYGVSDSPSGYAGYFIGRAQVTGDLTVISGGKVGIGVTSPANPLVIAGTESDIPGTGAQLMLRDTTNSSHAFALRIGSTGAADLHLDSYNGGWQTLMTVDRENGMVGIGTASPGATLDVEGARLGIRGETTQTTGFTAGVIGLSNSPEGMGVAGCCTATNGYGVLGECTSPQAIGVYGWAHNITSGVAYGVYGLSDAPSGYGVYYSGGLAGTGSKSCVVETSQGPTLLYCQESPENWFEDFGDGQLVDGRCHVELDPLFLETVTIDATNPLNVFLQPQDPECEGLAAVASFTGFDAIELRHGTSNGRFTYRVVGKRKGFEDKRLDYCRAAEIDSYLYPELREKELHDLEKKRTRIGAQRTTRMMENDPAPEVIPQLTD